MNSNGTSTPSFSNGWMNAFALVLVAVAVRLVGSKNYDRTQDVPRLHLLNVSYDPTRELYQEINPRFVAHFAKDTGRATIVEQSHGGSSRQARAVADGLEAEVVTLALPSDVESLHRRGLVADNWKARFPHDAQPYSSTIVFVVRKTNPKGIKDWPDLIAPGVEVVTPNPKTFGNGKLSVLAAWGSVTHRGGTEAQAREFVTKLYQNVAVLVQGSRDSTTPFTLGKEGDVHLTWENETIREVQESNGELEVVYPPESIRAEPSVAVVDINAAKHGTTTTAAQAYLAYLFTDEAQETFAKHGCRPIKPEILAKQGKRLPDLDLFPVTQVAKDWDDAQSKFFGDNGIFDAIHPTNSDNTHEPVFHRQI